MYDVKTLMLTGRVRMSAIPRRRDMLHKAILMLIGIARLATLLFQCGFDSQKRSHVA